MENGESNCLGVGILEELQIKHVVRSVCIGTKQSMRGFIICFLTDIHLPQGQSSNDLNILIGLSVAIISIGVCLSAFIGFRCYIKYCKSQGGEDLIM